ncbi:MAG: hypothetical protein ACK559_24945, partial [bacterium]
MVGLSISNQDVVMVVLCVDLSSAVIFRCSAACFRSRFLQLGQPQVSSLLSQGRLGSRPQSGMTCVNVGIAP